ncbi:MFS transporter [Sphingobium subterraneum]|uniref:MFS family permease n=1 Tax=Sphingobium subterraneum TaxID=627688 RepID=A0A841J322_9SPHN|nr:MFS transporter [Sphingobium subterraneum]MBB6125080.1 MFS family permease [Sphingobium subterraneum]
MATSTTAPQDHRFFAPLGIPVFRAIWFASMASNLGGLVQSVGASWMMTSLTKSPTLVALVQASTTLPIMLLALVAGAIADNHDRRIVMLVAQIFMLTVSVGLSLCAWLGWLTPWLLLSFTFLIGVGTALHAPSWQASVGDMVPRPVLPGAVALNSMGFNVARSFGPAIGGAVVAAAGAAAAFLVNAVSYLGLIVVLSRWRSPAQDRSLPPEPLRIAMGAGIRYVAMSPTIRTALLRAIWFGFAASATPALMPLVARHMLPGGAFTYGLLLGAFGMGAVAGALSGSRLRRFLSSEAMVGWATVAMATGAITLGLSHSIWLTFAALILAGGGWVLALSTFNVTVQMASPRWVVGRSLALYQMAAFGGLAVGSWSFGELAGVHGIPVALIAAGLLQLGGAALGLVLPLPVALDLDLSPLGRWKEPEIAVAIAPRSGPIVITLEYRIAPEDIDRFLVEMGERRRIRMRDGARNWTLLRDLTIDDLWIERYHVPTWHDYIRHSQRRTQEDAANIDRIFALQREGFPVVAHRMIERQVGRLSKVGTQDGDAFTDPTRTG